MANNKTNAKCTICNKEYTVCNSCLEQRTFKPWRTVTDTIEHYKIYLAIHGYTISKNKESAKKELEKCDLSGLESFNSEIKSVIQEIMDEPKKVKNVSRKEDKVEIKTDDVNE